MITTDAANSNLENTSNAPVQKGVDAVQVDALQALKQLLQLDRTAAKSEGVSLDSPATANIFAKNSDTSPAAGTFNDGQTLTIPPLVQPGAGDLTAADRQVAPLMDALKQDPGPLTFDSQPLVLNDAEKLLQHFSDDLKNGTLNNHPIWQNYIQTEREAAPNTPEWNEIAKSLDTTSTGQTLGETIKQAAHTPLDKNLQQQLQHALENNPIWQKAVAELELKKLISGQPDDTLKKYAAAHPEVNKTINQDVNKDKSDVAAEHKKLSDWADKTLTEPARSKFKKDMADFESRAQRDGLSQDEVLKTYQQIERLTKASGDKPLTATERRRITEQVMHQAADPTSVSQGSHNTCNVATVESRTYTRDPSDAARLVADVALTGQYKAADGTLVKVDPTPHDQSKTFPTRDGERSYASEIFQVTAVNVHYAKENATTGKNIRYTQTDEAKAGDLGDSGERLRDYSTTPPTDVKEGAPGKETAVHRPDLSDNDITDISDAITGKKEKDVLLQAFGTTKDGVTAVHSQAELQAKLKELKAQHKLPVIVYVDTNNEPFYTDSGRGTAGGSGGAHVVTITDYDEKTGNVCIDNEWDKAADHGKNNPVNVHDLFTAMQVGLEAQQLLDNDVKWNRAHGTVDPYKETDLVRHELASNTITKAQAEAETQRILNETKDRWAKNNVSEAEKARERSEIEALIHELPADAQDRMLRLANATKVIPDQSYNDKPIQQAAPTNYGRARQQNDNPSQSNPGTNQSLSVDYQKQLKVLNNASSALSQ